MCSDNENGDPLIIITLLFSSLIFYLYLIIHLIHFLKNIIYFCYDLFYH
jgi:hypothetical protein